MSVGKCTETSFSPSNVHRACFAAISKTPQDPGAQIHDSVLRPRPPENPESASGKCEKPKIDALVPPTDPGKSTPKKPVFCAGPGPDEARNSAGTHFQKYASYGLHRPFLEIGKSSLFFRQSAPFGTSGGTTGGNSAPQN